MNPVHRSTRPRRSAFTAAVLLACSILVPTGCRAGAASSPRLVSGQHDRRRHRQPVAAGHNGSRPPTDRLRRSSSQLRSTATAGPVSSNHWHGACNTTPCSSTSTSAIITPWPCIRESSKARCKPFTTARATTGTRPACWPNYSNSAGRTIHPSAACTCKRAACTYRGQTRRHGWPAATTYRSSTHYCSATA